MNHNSILAQIRTANGNIVANDSSFFFPAPHHPTIFFLHGGRPLLRNCINIYITLDNLARVSYSRYKRNRTNLQSLFIVDKHLQTCIYSLLDEIDKFAASAKTSKGQYFFSCVTVFPNAPRLGQLLYKSNTSAVPSVITEMASTEKESLLLILAIFAYSCICSVFPPVRADKHLFINTGNSYRLRGAFGSSRTGFTFSHEPSSHHGDLPNVVGESPSVSRRKRDDTVVREPDPQPIKSLVPVLPANSTSVVSRKSPRWGLLLSQNFRLSSGKPPRFRPLRGCERAVDREDQSSLLLQRG